MLHGIASPWSPVASLEDEEEDEKESVKASSQQEPQQQDVTQQQQNVTAEASSQRQRGKRARSVEASSLNPSTSASRKSLAWKYFKVISPQGADVVAECLYCHTKIKAYTRMEYLLC